MLLITPGYPENGVRVKPSLFQLREGYWEKPEARQVMLLPEMHFLCLTLRGSFTVDDKESDGWI